MSADQPVAASVRDVILARCDELERLARNAGSGGAWAAGGGRWEVFWTRRGKIGEVQVGPAGETPTVETLPPAAAHITAWDPLAVLALVAGARELCEIHGLWDGDGADVVSEVYGEQVAGLSWCKSCGGLTAWPCPTLAALARMLGLEVKS